MTDHKTLSKRFIAIKTELDEAEKSLTKLLGHIKSDWWGFSSDYKVNRAISSCRFSALQKSDAKRSRNSSESAEENASEDELPSKKIALRSAVVTKVESVRSRRDVIFKQNCNSKIQSRNRRMFGMVQSTLQKFQDDAVKRQSQDLKKIKVEQKVEAAEEEEKQLIKRQKIELISKQKEKQLELNCLKEMMELTELFEIWENNQKYLLNYSVTATEPKICFLPASHTSSSENHLEMSKIKIQEIIQKQKEIIEKELAKIAENYQLALPISKDTMSQDDSYSLEKVMQSAATEQKEPVEGSFNLHLSEDELLYSD